MNANSTPTFGETSSSVSPFVPSVNPTSSTHDRIAQLQQELDRLAVQAREEEERERLTRETELNNRIDQLPAMFGVADLLEVRSLITKRINPTTTSRHSSRAAYDGDAIDKAILKGASAPQVFDHFGLSHAAYYNRKKKLRNKGLLSGGSVSKKKGPRSRATQTA